MVTERPCTMNEAIATPDSTTHHRWRSAYVIVISWDLSPNSATKTTERLTRVAVSIETTFRRDADGPDNSARQASVEGLAHRVAVRRPGCAPVCRHDDWGLLPFADIVDDSGR